MSARGVNRLPIVVAALLLALVGAWPALARWWRTTTTAPGVARTVEVARPRTAPPLPQRVSLPSVALPSIDRGWEAAVDDPRIGQQLEPVSLVDLDGRPAADIWSHTGPKILSFLGTECPLVAKQMADLTRLARDGAAAGLAVWGVFANEQDTPEEIREFALRHGAPFSLVRDVGQRAADLWGARRTPEVLLIDAQQQIRYAGCITLLSGQQTSEPGTSEALEPGLARAVAELLAGQPISLPATSAWGCQIGRALTPDNDSPVTWSNTIAAIFQRRCQECHRPGQIGPFPLLTHADTVGWASTIEEVTSQRRMPPWGADPQHGKFLNDASLTPDELQSIRTWVAHGAPEGDPAQAPAPRTFREGWRLKNPDLVLPIQAEPFSVPATGAIDYQRFTVRLPYDEDKWVVAVEPRPDCAAVVHHVSVLVSPPINLELALERGQVVEVGGYIPGIELVLWTVEARPDGTLPDDAVGWAVIPRGYNVVIEMHYTPNGVAQTDRSEVAFKFGQAPPTQQRHAEQHNVFVPEAGVQRAPGMGVTAPAGSDHRTVYASNWEFVVPPHTANFPVDAWYTFAEDVDLHFLIPHMHWRGQSFRFTARFPDGHEQILLDVPRYDFNWQHVYRLAEPLPLPRGTRVHCAAQFDNSRANPRNPNPAVPAIPGLQSWNEMDNGVLGFVVAETDADGRRALDPAAAAREMLEHYLPADQVPTLHLANYYMQRALCRQAWGDEPGSLADLEAALAADPTHLETLRLRAAWRTERGDTAGALADYDRALNLSADDAELWCLRGRLRARTGDPVGAASDLAAALRLRPYYPEAHLYLARLAHAQGDLADAASRLDLLLSQIHPRFYKAFRERALVRFAQGDAQGAEQDLEACWKEKPTFAEDLAVICLQAKRPRAAQRFFGRAVDLDPTRAAAWQGLVTSQLRGEPPDVAGALAALDQAATHGIAATELAELRAQALRLAGRYSEAIVALEDLLAHDASHLEAANLLAWMLATCPDESLLQPPRAVALAGSTCQATQFQHASYLDTLAAALAAAGQFTAAQTRQLEAIEQARRVGREASLPAMQARWNLYRTGQPYREPAPPATTPPSVAEPASR